MRQWTGFTWLKLRISAELLSRCHCTKSFTVLDCLILKNAGNTVLRNVRKHLQKLNCVTSQKDLNI